MGVGSQSKCKLAISEFASRAVYTKLFAFRPRGPCQFCLGVVNDIVEALACFGCYIVVCASPAIRDSRAGPSKHSLGISATFVGSLATDGGYSFFVNSTSQRLRQAQLCKHIMVFCLPWLQRRAFVGGYLSSCSTQPCSVRSYRDF